jgi:hypothetical protein
MQMIFGDWTTLQNHHIPISEWRLLAFRHPHNVGFRRNLTLMGGDGLVRYACEVPGYRTATYHSTSHPISTTIAISFATFQRHKSSSAGRRHVGFEAASSGW